MANQINDGQVAYGSREIAISGKGTFETDDFKYNTPVKLTLRMNAQDLPSGRVAVKQDVQGSATFQYLPGAFPSGAIIPAFGDQFTTTEPFGSATWSITDVGDEERKDGEAKCPVKFVLNISSNVSVQSLSVTT